MTEYSDSSTVPGGKPALALLIVLCLGFLFMLPYKALDELTLYKSLDFNPVALRVRTSVVPLIVGTPMIIVLIFTLAKRYKGTLTDNDSIRTLKTVLINGTFSILMIFLSSWQQANWLTNLGYERCKRLTGTTLYAAKAWVIDKSYCIEDGFHVKTDLLEWTLEQATLGNTLTPEQVSQKADEPLENTAWNKR